MQIGQDIPWKRLGAEAVVIVTSILLAFAIDAWWGKRAEFQIEQELLINILDSITATEDGILTSYKRMAIDEKEIDYFFNASDSELQSIPQESFMGIYVALWRASSFDATVMMQTSEIGLIRDSQVRRTLIKWLDTSAEIASSNRRSDSLSQSAHLALSRHALVQQFTINGNESLSTQIDLSAIRNDEELMAIVSSKKQGQDIRRTLLLPNLQSLNKELQQLLDIQIQ